MTMEPDMRAADPGLDSLLTLFRFQGISADSEQIRHRLGNHRNWRGGDAPLRQGLGLKARAIRTDWARLARTPLPAIAMLRDGSFLLLGKVADDKVLVQSPARRGRN